MQTLTLSTTDLKPEQFYASVLKTTKEQSSPKTRDSSKTHNSEYTNLQKKNLKGESNPPLNQNPNQRSSSLTVPRSWLSYEGYLSTQALMRSIRSSKTSSMLLAPWSLERKLMAKEQERELFCLWRKKKHNEQSLSSKGRRSGKDGSSCSIIRFISTISLYTTKITLNLNETDLELDKSSKITP